MEMTFFNVLWFFLIFVLIGGYFVLDGFDLGAGVLYPFVAKGDEEKAVVRTSIGPVWDGNEVWLLTAGGALFAAQCQNGTYEPMVWQCVYRRGFLTENHLRMAEGLLFEDELFQAPALLKAGRAAAFDDVILHYRQRAGSIMASFARNAKWCDSYVQVCARLHDVAQSLPDGAAKAALNKRVGQIALSVGKNIPAYHLPPEVAREATDFLKAHRRQLARYAMESGDAAVAVQGALLKLSPELFIKLYQGAKA